MSHDFQEKDYNIWHKPADLFQIHSNLTSILEQQFDGYNNADSERPYFDDACDAVIQFFKCIINKEIDALQDDSSDVLEPEQSKNLTAVQNDINSLADDFNNDENELTEDDLSDELKRNQKKVQKIGLSLCPKKRETENRSDKMKINRAVSHLNDVIFDFTYYYGFLTKYNAYKQRKQVPAWEYPFLSIKCSNHSK